MHANTQWMILNKCKYNVLMLQGGYGECQQNILDGFNICGIQDLSYVHDKSMYFSFCNLARTASTCLLTMHYIYFDTVTAVPMSCDCSFVHFC